MTSDNRFKGRGEMISLIAYSLHTGLQDDRHPDAEEVRQAAPKMRAYLASELREVEAIMQARLAVVRAEARTVTTAAIEAKSWLREDDLEGYVAYERHLQRALYDATRELERAVARRRLRGLARTIGVG